MAIGTVRNLSEKSCILDEPEGQHALEFASRNLHPRDLPLHNRILFFYDLGIPFFTLPLYCNQKGKLRDPEKFNKYLKPTKFISHQVQMLCLKSLDLTG